MTPILPTVVVLTLAIASSSHAQGMPDFSGTWRMDPSRSESAQQGKPIGPVTVTISQTDSELRIQTARGENTSTAVYKLDGSRGAVPGGTATVRWEGSTLVIESVLDVQGAAVTTRESRRLAAAGNEMEVDRVVAVQHGYTAQSNEGRGRDVFVRVRP